MTRNKIFLNQYCLALFHGYMHQKITTIHMNTRPREVSFLKKNLSIIWEGIIIWFEKVTYILLLITEDTIVSILFFNTWIKFPWFSLVLKWSYILWKIHAFLDCCTLVIKRNIYIPLSGKKITNQHKNAKWTLKRRFGY